MIIKSNDKDAVPSTFEIAAHYFHARARSFIEVFEAATKSDNRDAVPSTFEIAAMQPTTSCSDINPNQKSMRRQNQSQFFSLLMFTVCSPRYQPMSATMSDVFPFMCVFFQILISTFEIAAHYFHARARTFIRFLKHV